MPSTFSNAPYHAPTPKWKRNRKESASTRSEGPASGTTGRAAGRGGEGPDRRGSRYGRAALQSELARLDSCSAGDRHISLFRAAARLGELVSGGELDRSWTRAQLEAAGDRLKPGRFAEVRRCVRDGLSRGERRPRSAPQSYGMIRNAADARVRLAAFAASAEADPARWSGVEGATALRVLLGLVTLGLRAGKVRLHVSHRELSLASGVGLGSIGAALERLEGNWIRIVARGNRRRSKEPTRIQLLVDVGRDPLPPANGAGGTAGGGGHGCSFVAQSGAGSDRVVTARAPGPLAEGLADPGCELWRRRGNAWRLWRALDAAAARGEDHSAAELADGLGMALRTVWRNLAWLGDCGLVERYNGRWRRVGERDAEPVVERLELVPRQLVAQRYRLESELHRARLYLTGLRGWWQQAAPQHRAPIEERIAAGVARHRELRSQLDRHRQVIADARERERAAARRRRGRGGFRRPVRRDAAGTATQPAPPPQPR